MLWFSSPFRRAAGVTIVLATLATLACGPERPTPDTLAISDAGSITTSDLDTYLLTLSPQRQAPPSGSDPEGWWQHQLGDLIMRKLLEHEARETGLAGGPRVVEAQEAILIEAARRSLLPAPTAVTLAEVEAHYRDHAEQYHYGERIDLSHIFLRVNPGDDDARRSEIRDKLNALGRQVAAGAKFADLAREHSQSETGPLGGKIGPVEQGKLPPAVEGGVWALPTGATSEVVETPDGFHIFRVDARLPPSSVPLDEVRGRIASELARNRQIEYERVLLESLLIDSGARYHAERFNPSGEPADAAILEIPNSEGQIVQRMTLGEIAARLNSLSFLARRQMDDPTRLDQWVTQRLLLDWAERNSLREQEPIADLLARSEREELIAAASEAAVDEAKNEQPDSELNAFFDGRPERFIEPALYHFRILTIALPEDEPPVFAYRRAAEIVRRVRAGETTFEAEARQHSDDPSRVDGGAIEPLTLDQFTSWATDLALDEVSALEPGQVTEPTLIANFDIGPLERDRRGYLVTALDRIEPEHVPTFEEARERVANVYFDENSDRLLEQIRDRLFERYDVTVFEDQS